MEFPETGTHCSRINCHQLDFLPLTCSFCNSVFCKDHSFPEHHHCPNFTSNQLPITSQSTITSYPCSMPTCSLVELVPVTCPHCVRNFCLNHRHQPDHNCPHYAPPQEKMVATATLIKQIQEKTSAKTARAQGAKSEALASKIQLMKLKQKSEGAREIPLEERVYFLARLPNGTEKAVFVSKQWSVGKCIDAIGSLCKLANYNNVATGPKLNLFSSNKTCLSEQKDSILNSMIDAQIIFNGQTVIVDYV